VLTSGQENRAIIFFNSTKFTRWPVHSKKIVSAYRTLEDKLILGAMDVKVKYLFGCDESIKNLPEPVPRIEWGLNLKMPSKMYSPLGVGGNRNHLQVRAWAIKRWLEWGKKCQLLFYEDLPYAAKLGASFEDVEHSIIGALEPVCGKIQLCLEPLSAESLRRKLFLSRSYFSQTDYSQLLEDFAKIRGRSLKTGFAEAIYKVV